MKQEPGVKQKKVPSSEIARRSIENDILSGVLYPNQRLIEQEIAARLGLSRAPVREALKELEVKGLVTRLPTRGLVVTAISENDIRQTFEVREALETKAIRLVCENITPRALRNLNRYVDNHQKEVRRYLRGEQPEIDPRWSVLFHLEQYQACNNSKLIRCIEELRDVEQLVYVAQYFREPEYELFYEEHKALLKGLGRHDPEEAVAAVRAHLDTMRRIYLRYLRR